MTLTSSRNKKNTPENYGPWCLSKSPLVKETHLQTTNFSGGLTHVNIPGCIRHNKTLTDWNGQEATWLVFAGIRLCKASLPLGSNRDHNLQSVDFLRIGILWDENHHHSPLVGRIPLGSIVAICNFTPPSNRKPKLLDAQFTRLILRDLPMDVVTKTRERLVPLSIGTCHGNSTTVWLVDPPTHVCVSRSPWVELFGEILLFMLQKSSGCTSSDIVKPSNLKGEIFSIVTASPDCWTIKSIDFQQPKKFQPTLISQVRPTPNRK